MAATLNPASLQTTFGYAMVNGQRVPVSIDLPWYLYLTKYLFDRVGGYEAPSITDLAVTEYADAGVEETKFELYRLADEFRQSPIAALQVQVETLIAEASEQRDQIAELTKTIQDLKQGTLV